MSKQKQNTPERPSTLGFNLADIAQAVREDIVSSEKITLDGYTNLAEAEQACKHWMSKGEPAQNLKVYCTRADGTESEVGESFQPQEGDKYKVVVNKSVA